VGGGGVGSRRTLPLQRAVEVSRRAILAVTTGGCLLCSYGPLGLLALKCYSVMDIEEIKAKVRANEYIYSHHADLERRADDLTLAQVEDALLTGAILEQYPDTGRGESCLVLGFSRNIPVHAVCGWRGDRVVLITVYIPGPPQFVDPWTRGESQ
jgi:hypothetical protein